MTLSKTCGVLSNIDTKIGFQTIGEREASCGYPSWSEKFEVDLDEIKVAVGNYQDKVTAV